MNVSHICTLISTIKITIWVETIKEHEVSKSRWCEIELNMNHIFWKFIDTIKKLSFTKQNQKLCYWITLIINNISTECRSQQHQKCAICPQTAVEKDSSTTASGGDNNLWINNPIAEHVIRIRFGKLCTQYNSFSYIAIRYNCFVTAVV